MKSRRMSRRSFLVHRARRRHRRHRQPHHHQGSARAGAPARSSSAITATSPASSRPGASGTTRRQSGGRYHQQGRRHRRAQGRAGDRGYRVESRSWRTQAAQPDPARQRRVHRRLGAFRRDAGGAADRVRAEDPLFLHRRGHRGDRIEGHALLLPHRHRHLLDRRRQHALVRRQSRQGMDHHLCRLCLGPEHEPGIQAVHREGRRQGPDQHPGAARYQGFRAVSGADSGRYRGAACRPSSARCRSPSTRRPRPWASTRR